MAVSKTTLCINHLSLDRIHGRFDDDIISCPICKNILWKPVTCKICENSFCLECIRLWFNRKPNKCPFNCQFQERKPPPILIKLLSKLKLNCQNKSNGCEILIPYEALEKHELSECLFRLTQCPDCSQEVLYKDLENHQKDNCLSKQITCLKCNTIYNQQEEHKDVDCLKKQIIIIEEIMDASEQVPNRLREHFNKIVQLYERQQIDENDMQHSLRILTVDFSDIPQTKNEGDRIPNDYAGFNWENLYSMFEEYVIDKYQLKGFMQAFTNSRKCVAYNGKGNAISIFLSNTFGLHSFEAMSIYHDNFKLIVTGYRSNVIIEVRNIILTNKNCTKYEINWEKIDKINFKPERIWDTGKPETFVLTYLHFIV